MGIKHFLTTSDGIQIKPLNSLRKIEKKLRREQRKLVSKKRI
jgi:transposase